MKQVFFSGMVRTPDDVSIVPETFKDHLNTSHFKNWKGKPLHGKYVSNLYDNICAHSLGWLAHSDLKIETESLILAAQDQALNAKYYNASILGGSDSSCRLCASEIETVAHIVSGCPTLAGTLYKKRHDEIGRHLHWCLCSQFGFPVERDWWKHNPDL